MKLFRKNLSNRIVIGILSVSLLSCNTENEFYLDTDYLTLEIDSHGFLSSIKSKTDDKEYLSLKKGSPLLALYEGNDKAILPTSAWSKDGNIVLSFSNGAKATVVVEEKDQYITFKLLSLENRGKADHVVWGPYYTTVREYIGDLLGVVSNDQITIGMVALNDITNTGLPTDGDMNQMYYKVHTPDPIKYPLPDSLKEGQKFRIGGDGISDVAFTNRKEGYFFFNKGNGADYIPNVGSYIVMNSRDRRQERDIFFTLIPGFNNVNVPKHQRVEAVDEDMVGSSVAFFICPKKRTLKLYEQIVKNEGLPYITNRGKWVRDPEAACADLAWWGKHDSLISYASQLGVYAVQDEGLGEYYANPANRWANKTISFNGENITISEFTQIANKAGIAYGLHTLCEFLQPHCSDVSPVPNDSLCTVLKTEITNEINATQTDICVADTSWLNERGTWHCNNLNVLKLGKELLTYEGVSKTRPYTLIGVKRGAYNTLAQPHKIGEILSKLQMNCYNGFVPNMKLQDDYANYYAKLLADGGMNYIDFDGQESFMYQGHGFYSMKRFYRNLFDKFHEYGGNELRVMGSGIMYGNWLYMGNGNIGGGNNMFNPVTNSFGIQGKDERNGNNNNFICPTFGIQNFDSDWNVQVIENLQSKAVAWNATYMLGLSEKSVENCKDKASVFKAFRIWEDARRAGIFPAELKEEMKEQNNRYHLERNDNHTWTLYDVDSSGKYINPRKLEAQ
ncbi:MAG: hypothetical protein MSK40_05845 [Parabacteroides sp.]|nr:hypothetical protein [Parabacteroides sp.]